MARPPINTGSSALQAYMQGVANMGQVRAQMQQNTTNAINALGDTFTKWQDDFNKRKHLKWTQQMEEAKLAETKRVNDANIDIANRGMVLKETAQPHEIASLNANTAYTNEQRLGARQKRLFEGEVQDHARKMKLLNDKNAVQSIIAGTPPAAAAPNSNGVGTTGNATQLNAGGVNLGSGEASSGMGVVNGVKKPTATNTKSTKLSFIPQNYSYTG